MFLQRYKLRWSFIIFVLLVVAGAFVTGLQRLIFDVDLVASLPQDDPILADARRIITNHPIQDRVVIDVSRSEANGDELVRAAMVIEKRLCESGLFARVGLDQEQPLILELIFSITGRLPVLFSAKELEEKVKPLLDPAKIRAALSDHLAHLGQLESIGQPALIAQDPLNLRNLIFPRLSHLAPTQNGQIYKGHLLSAGGAGRTARTRYTRAGTNLAAVWHWPAARRSEPSHDGRNGRGDSSSQSSGGWRRVSAMGSARPQLTVTWIDCVALLPRASVASTVMPCTPLAALRRFHLAL